MTEQLRCDDVREVAPDIALGLLTGEERADALAHLERCEGCRAEVASLSVAADEVLLTAPEAAPPPGFADRVVARLASERAAGDALPAVSGLRAAAPARPPGRGRRGVARGGRLAGRSGDRRRPLALAALAAAAAVLAAAGLLGVLRDDGAGAEAAVAEMRTGSGAVVGAATAEGDDTTLVTLDVPGWDAMVEQWGAAPAGSYRLVVEQDDGARTVRALAADVDDWSLRVDAPVDDIATVSMLDAEGRVWCTGRFAPT